MNGFFSYNHISRHSKSWTSFSYFSEEYLKCKCKYGAEKVFLKQTEFKKKKCFWAWNLFLHTLRFCSINLKKLKNYCILTYLNLSCTTVAHDAFTGSRFCSLKPVHTTLPDGTNKSPMFHPLPYPIFFKDSNNALL